MQAEAPNAQHSYPSGPPGPDALRALAADLPRSAAGTPWQTASEDRRGERPRSGLLGAPDWVAPRRSDLSAALHGLAIATVLLALSSALGLLIVSALFATSPGSIA